jgi:hypothetical protein
VRKLKIKKNVLEHDRVVSTYRTRNKLSQFLLKSSRYVSQETQQKAVNSPSNTTMSLYSIIYSAILVLTHRHHAIYTVLNNKVKL